MANKGFAMGRVIVFGLDGADPDLLFPWAQKGHLPNLRRVMEGGAFGRLKSTRHPLTPQAWTSMITGVNPGRHGIFDFGMRKKGSYEIELVTSRHRAFPTIFETMPRSVSCGVCNVPLSFPVDPINGFAIGGMHTPSAETPGFTHPPELRDELKDYVIDVMSHWYPGGEQFIADLHGMIASRHENFLRLFDRRKPDVFFAVYVALDRAQHALWGRMTAAHRAEPGKHGGIGDEIFHVAKKLDDCLGDYIERLGPKDHLLLVSDHGFGDLKGDLYLNRWLIDEGYLSFDPAKVRAWTIPDDPGADDPKHGWHRRLVEGPLAPLPDDDEAVRKGLIDPRYKTWATVDWRKTRAWSAGLFGNLWINCRGREPQGSVEPGREYEALKSELIEKLRGLRHPADGDLLCSDALRREDLYRGDCLGSAPDIVAVFRDYEYMTRGGTEFFGDGLVGEVAVGHTGNHRMHGVAALLGPASTHGRMPDGNILEIAPMIAYLAGTPIPCNLDAGLSSPLLDEKMASAHPPKTGAATPARRATDHPGNESDMREVAKRLRGLGYLA